MRERIVAPLRSRAFRWVWGGEGLSMLGDCAFDVAFIWLVLQVTGSPVALAGAMLAQAVPRAVLMLLGGAITDRFSPRTVMLVSHLTRGAAVGALGLVAAIGDVAVWHLLLLAAVMGAAEAFFWPASGSILPSLVAARDLPRANALVGLAEQVARLAGPVLGGLAVAGAGPALVFLLNAVTFFVAAATLRAAPRAPRDPAEAATSVTAIRDEIVSGFRYAGRSWEIRVVLLLISAATLSYSGLFAVGLPALAGTFPQGALALGLLLSAWGLGQLLGTVGAGITGLPARWGILIIGVTLCEGAAFAGLGFLPNPWAAAALLVVLGIGVAYSTDVALPTFVQTRTPGELLGRVNSILNAPRVVLEPLSLALMGVVVAIDVRWGFAMAAVPMLAVGLTLLASRNARQLRMPTAAAGGTGAAAPSVPVESET
ncbi:MFS transporter [Pseudonocardia xinjiangensis]|uniref:MFS transporter n=1 Tax=Pseudonocardia xinjiangensis TaxID=75289 RepID=UPI003D8DFC6B